MKLSVSFLFFILRSVVSQKWNNTQNSDLQWFDMINLAFLVAYVKCRRIVDNKVATFVNP